jgi:hypothetical protein
LPAPKKVRILPFTHQADILDALVNKQVKIIVVVSGRGAGKTTAYLYAVNMKASEFLRREGDFVIWIGTPTMTGTGDKPWRELVAMFGPRGPYAGHKAKIDAQSKLIRCKNVTIRLRPIIGRDSGGNEGDAIHFLIIDEAGHKDITAETFDSMYPAVTRVDGQVMICGTPPKGVVDCNSGWFREKWNMGFDENSPIKSAQWRTFDSPVYGGGILPPIPTVAQFAVMNKEQRDKAMQIQRDCITRVDELVKECVADPKKLEALETIATGTTHEDYRKALLGAISRRLETMDVHIFPHIDRGQPEEAAREYDGEWLPRPATLGEEELNFLKLSVREGVTSAMRDDGVEVPGVGSLTRWERPVPGASYVIGIDSAAGGGGDYTVIAVIRRPEDPETGNKIDMHLGEQTITPVGPAKLVALLRTNTMPADQAGMRAYYLAQQYNGALVIPEITGHYGRTIIYAMRNRAAVDNTGVWIWDDSGKPALISSHGQGVEDLGWNTSHRSKGFMLTVLRSYMYVKMLISPSQVFYDEVLDFNWELGAGAKNDDTIVAVSIALAGIELCPEGVPIEETFEEMYERALFGETNGDDEWHL